jgi:YHS domain-containing protein
VPAAEFLLEHMSRTVFDPVDTTAVASLAPRLRARVNGEIYRFAGAATLARFRRDPVRWCGILRDPVSGVRFIPRRGARRVDLGDGPYFFMTDSTWRVFRADTAAYAIHRDY